MSTLKILAAAAVTAATVSLAFAQGVPPRPATDPAVGAGQRSTQNTPMGTTGTPGGSGISAQGSTAGSAAATTAGSVGASSSGSMNSGASAGNTTSGGSSMASGTGSGTHHAVKKAKKKRVAKADRN